MKKKFDTEIMQELAYSPVGEIFPDDKLGDFEVVKNEILDKSRWSIHYHIVFKNNDKFYGVSYSRGATEMQDQHPFEYEGDEIECEEFKQTEIKTIEYVQI